MPSRTAIILGVCWAILGCEKETPPASDTHKREDAGVSQSAAIDPDLAQAVAAASAGVPSPAAATSGGPPPNGIFAPGAADREIERGKPPKLTLGSDGGEPKITLFPAQPKPGAKQSGTIQIVQQSEGGGLPIEFGVTFEASKPKAEGATSIPVSVKVTAARISMPGAPKELEQEVAKLKGAKVEYEVLPDGAGTGYRFEAPKAAKPELVDMVRALSDSLAVVTLPYPQQAVGLGAYWMATSRDGVAGLDLVTYRLVKVERIEGQKVTLNVNTKRYSATSAFDLPGLGPNAPHTLAEFQALAEGTVEIVAGKGFPSGGSQNSGLGASLQDPANPRARGVLELRTRTELHF